MGKKLRRVANGFYRSQTIRTRAERLTRDLGVVLLREVLDATDIVAQTETQMMIRLPVSETS